MHESCHSTELLRGGESPRVCGIQIATCRPEGTEFALVCGHCDGQWSLAWRGR